MALALRFVPEADGDELAFLQHILNNMDEEKALLFSSLYRARRRDPLLILVTCLIGLAGIAGIHRILIRQVGMGILYLLTAGLCLIGTIVDAVNYRQLAAEFNRKVAEEVISMMKNYG